MQCLLCGDRTPVLHVRCGWDPDSDDDQPCDPQLDANSVFNGFVLSAGGDILCFALSRQSTAAQCAAVLTSLQEHASVYELELPLGEWEGVTTAPTAESSQVPDWMVSRMPRLGGAAARDPRVGARGGRRVRPRGRGRERSDAREAAATAAVGGGRADAAGARGGTPYAVRSE